MTATERAAHDLAEVVRRQWSNEAGLRGLSSPEPIRVRWSSTGWPVAAELRTILDTDAIGSLLRLRGDLRQVIDVFHLVSSRRLVILGEPASGKSVLALLLAAGGLPSDEPVPVLLTVSTWNPREESLNTWLTRKSPKNTRGWPTPRSTTPVRQHGSLPNRRSYRSSMVWTRCSGSYSRWPSDPSTRPSPTGTH